MSRHLRAGALALTLLVVVALAACGSSDGGSDGERSTEATTTTAAARTCLTSDTGEPVLDYTEQPTADLDPS